MEILGGSGGRGGFDVNSSQKTFSFLFLGFVGFGVNLSRISLAIHGIDFIPLQNMLLAAVLCQNIADIDISDEKAIVKYYVAHICLT